MASASGLEARLRARARRIFGRRQQVRGVANALAVNALRVDGDVEVTPVARIALRIQQRQQHDGAVRRRALRCPRSRRRSHSARPAPRRGSPRGSRSRVRLPASERDDRQRGRRCRRAATATTIPRSSPCQRGRASCGRAIRSARARPHAWRRPRAAKGRILSQCGWREHGEARSSDGECTKRTHGRMVAPKPQAVIRRTGAMEITSCRRHRTDRRIAIESGDAGRLA